ncbi:hypothetical protein MGYG_02557 [Nannizzia gypsea CBS 118893]|uniref:Uncharacterized protein n=1 Tax=Arthroderma gypseum (strain ATCC MYA-4604 / CBS 118893) TaxID=535722 RepID=E4UN83_ARTGP|nr:hypothetical protein MGYG_02557 [Nannizzia gypsea CBS 118893]EFQ99544.1 hypothetical protein MGYG_02557 [Nannizzia gypsea CBS 118893]
MLSTIVRFSVLPLILAWLVLLAAPVQADNFLSHAYERLWLWERYQIACAIEGPDKQQSILPFKTQKGQESKNNKGTGPDKMLTYTEFITRLDDKPLPPDVGKLTPPGDGRSVTDAVSELIKNKVTGELNIITIDPSLRGKNYNKPPESGGGKKPGTNGGSRSLYDPKDPYRTPYTVLFDKLENSLSKYRLDDKNKAVIDKHIENLKACSKATVQLRAEKTMDFVAKKLAAPVADGGLGIDVRLTWKDSTIPGADKYPEIDFKETYEANKEKLKNAGFKNRKDVTDWVTRFGDPKYAGKVEFGPGAFSHFRTLVTWRDAEHRINLSAAELGTCKLE